MNEQTLAILVIIILGIVLGVFILWARKEAQQMKGGKK